MIYCTPAKTRQKSDNEAYDGVGEKLNSYACLKPNHDTDLPRRSAVDTILPFPG